MYLYSLHGYDVKIIITHDEKFAKENFIEMCNEIPKISDSFGDGNYYDEDGIVKHLVENYGFKEATFEAGLFVD